jgi:hypothetical protein
MLSVNWLKYEGFNEEIMESADVLGALARLFLGLPGVLPRAGVTVDSESTRVTSLLYNAIIKGPLHIRCLEVSSTFFEQFLRVNTDRFCGYSYLSIAKSILRRRQLSAQEISALRGYSEFWWQPSCVTAIELHIMLNITIVERGYHHTLPVDMN